MTGGEVSLVGIEVGPPVQPPEFCDRLFYGFHLLEKRFEYPIRYHVRRLGYAVSIETKSLNFILEFSNKTAKLNLKFPQGSLDLLHS